ncbi:MAG: hypothetical protein PHN42_00515 [Bacilli bacterium]|nr:hypothetical protein [Bacilli bacterium]
MKREIKFRIVFSSIIFLIALICIIYSFAFYQGESREYISGFGFGLLSVSLFIIVKNIIIINNPKKLKKIEIEEKDERNLKIMCNSYALAFRITLLIEAFSCIIITLLNMKDISMAIASLLSIQLFIYLITYLIMSKKI